MFELDKNGGFITDKKTGRYKKKTAHTLNPVPFIIYDPLYNNVDKQLIPATECLKDVVNRFMPIWESDIKPALESNKKIIISAYWAKLKTTKRKGGKAWTCMYV